MTDRQYYAKNWLLQLSQEQQLLRAEQRALEHLKGKLSGGVSRYDRPAGRGDPITAQAAQEDAMIDYSMQLERVERARHRYARAVENIQKVFDNIPARFKPIAIDRYINGLKWEKIEDIYSYSSSQVFVINNQILEAVAAVLEAKKTELIIDDPKETAATAS